MKQGLLPSLQPHHRRPGTLKARSVPVKETHCRTILSPSSLTDYSLNPYTGCTHNCSYCYAHYMQRYSGHKEPWGKFVDVKINAVQALTKQLRRIPPSTIFMSSVTDPYQPIEKHYCITRRLLQILYPLNHYLMLHTKSSLIERDIDIIKKFKQVSVCFTIVTGDEEARKFLEPGASPVRERIRVIKKLSPYGIATSVFIGPIIPFVTERNLESLLRQLMRAGVKKIMLDDLHYLDRLSNRLFPVLERYEKGITRKFSLLRKDYYAQIAEFVLEFCKKHGIKCYKIFK